MGSSIKTLRQWLSAKNMVPREGRESQIIKTGDNFSQNNHEAEKSYLFHWI